MSAFRTDGGIALPHDWLFCRLPATGLPELPELIRALQAADDVWFFDAPVDARDHGLTLWFHAPADRLGELRALLRADHGSRVAEDRTTARPPDFPGVRGLALADELAVVSSRLAVAIAADGGLRHEEGPAWAVRHLRHLVDLVPQRDRRAFLFACWQQWTVGLEPAHRVDLGLQAEIEAGSVPRGETAGPATGPWSRYTEATRVIAAAPEFTADAPANYLLLDHAHRTHSRLGLAPAVEALAARTVRAELDATGALAALATPALQKA
ncbi:hypothetical protein ACFWB3_18830 [[Kitasatospora] papulosa]|uniref:hypothetical protein n=1 Tax=[Kitasatospora] papulosa TaxID=1464011 RepID=UPI0036C6185E